MAFAISPQAFAAMKAIKTTTATDSRSNLAYPSATLQSCTQVYQSCALEVVRQVTLRLPLNCVAFTCVGAGLLPVTVRDLALAIGLRDRLVYLDTEEDNW